ncbi:MAG: LCP family protein [Ruminococcus sp.]
MKIVKNTRPEDGFVPMKKKNSVRDILVIIVSVAVSLVLIVAMVLNVPIINYEKTEKDTITTQQVSILKYWKLWQPLVEKEGTLSKVDSADASALNLKSSPDSDVNDGLDLDQIIEGQYTILFLGMDESGELSDVDWIFQFDLIAGTMNILQIPRDSYMPDYASYSTAKFNSIYHSGQETGVTPIQRVVNAIQDNFCIYVDCYVKLNCDDIANIVDSIGGIPITLPEEIVYEADKVLPAGEQVLNGQQSEWFVRFRHGYIEGDIGRVKAQRIFLAAAMEKMLNMSQTELMSAMQKIYKNQWIATDLSLEQISMVADFASARLSMDTVNVFMVPGEGATYYPGDGSGQSVYSIHKGATIDLLNEFFRPYQNEIYPEESAIVELVPEGSYLETTNDDTQESLANIHEGDSDDGAQQ